MNALAAAYDDMMGHELNNVAGRLVCGRVYAPTRATEVPLIQAELKSIITAVKKSIIICVDIRRLGQLDPTSQAAYQEMLVSDNKFVEYSALLADRSANSLQFYRTVQEAKNPHRQIFLRPDDLENWLRPHLDPSEVAAMQKFVKARMGAQS